MIATTTTTRRRARPVRTQPQHGDPRKVRKTASALLDCMMWAATPQGHEYWRTVHANLLALAAELDRMEGRP